MRCYCCAAESPVARKVKLRPWLVYDGSANVPDVSGDQFRRRLKNYRWTVICLACYRLLDNERGVAEVGGRWFNIADASRGDKAAILDEANDQQWQQKETDRRG
jgi:hypothetical protein